MTLRQLICTALLISSTAAAQSNELSLTMGVYATRHVQMKNDQMFAIQGSVARRVFHVPKAALYVELPVTASLDNRAKATAILRGQTFATRNYSALFVVPGISLKIGLGNRISPYVVFGAGLAHFSKTGGSDSTNTNVIDYGGGFDVKLNRLFAFRAEVRDFYSGPPQLITGLLDREHQIIATGGLVFRF